MKEEKQFNLNEAIKKFYKTEPLKQDLAARVNNRVFEKKENDNRLCVIGSIQNEEHYRFF